MDRLKTMESFVRVVKAGSFSAAAGQLGMSRAMVTKHIIALERRLGARLLNRTTRRLALTEIGGEYYEFCARILREFETEEFSVARLQKEPQGSLRVIAPKSFGSLHLGAAIAKFALAYPKIAVSLILEDSSVRTFEFAENEYDVAIRLSPIANSTIAARKIGSLPWVVCASPAYLKRRGAPAAPKDLARHNCLLHVKLSPDRIWRFGGAAKTNRSIKVDGTFSSNSVLILRDAALAGLGVALLPTYCVGHDLDAGTLRRVLPEFPIRDRPLYVLFPENRLIPKKVRIFIAFIAAWYRSAQSSAELGPVLRAAG